MINYKKKYLKYKEKYLYFKLIGGTNTDYKDIELISSAELLEINHPYTLYTKNI